VDDQNFAATGIIMAILLSCTECGKDFMCSRFSFLCQDCDGTNDKRRAEEERWAALSIEDKVNELRNMIINLQTRINWGQQF
jgi:hypothetical protein